MELYFLNSVQLSCDFGKMVPSGTVTRNQVATPMWTLPDLGI